MWIAFQITLIGMGLVFAAIGLLWAVMVVLVRVTTQTEPSAPAETETPVIITPPPDTLQQKAAAIAVAVALAQQASVATPHEFPLPPTAFVSAWQAVRRSAQLSQRGPVR